MSIQLYSLISSSQNSDAAEVTISATVLALNLMVLPVVTLFAGFIFKSATSIVAATLIMGKDFLPTYLYSNDFANHFFSFDRDHI